MPPHLFFPFIVLTNHFFQPFVQKIRRRRADAFRFDDDEAFQFTGFAIAKAIAFFPLDIGILLLHLFVQRLGTVLEISFAILDLLHVLHPAPVSLILLLSKMIIIIIPDVKTQAQFFFTASQAETPCGVLCLDAAVSREI